ncbi:MAG: hypothetical protein HYY19_02765 [Candidatus Rokubacteria bacterium]|nr:hypothetical protein [Candidatus Rokubacteria bacterium]
MSKSLGRLDVVRDVKTELSTQSSTLTFKPGRPIDFRALADAVDRAGFKAGKITIWATGTLKVGADGRAIFTVSGTNQALPVADSPQLAPLKKEAGKEIPIVAEVRFQETPPRLVIASAKPGMEGMPGMKGMGQ